MKLPILTARYWTIGPFDVAPGWLMVSWGDRHFMLACVTCGHLTTGCGEHRWCGLCKQCRAVEEA